MRRKRKRAARRSFSLPREMPSGKPSRASSLSCLIATLHRAGHYSHWTDVGTEAREVEVGHFVTHSMCLAPKPIASLGCPVPPVFPGMVRVSQAGPGHLFNTQETLEWTFEQCVCSTKRRCLDEPFILDQKIKRQSKN